MKHQFAKRSHVHFSDPDECHRLAERLARPVALGYLSEDVAKAALVSALVKAAPDCDHFAAVCSRLVWTLSDARSEFLRKRENGAVRIRRAVWPLCEQRAPGNEIIEAALRVSNGTLSRDDVVDICRAVAAQVLRGARRANR